MPRRVFDLPNYYGRLLWADSSHLLIDPMDPVTGDSFPPQLWDVTDSSVTTLPPRDLTQQGQVFGAAQGRLYYIDTAGPPSICSMSLTGTDHTCTASLPAQAEAPIAVSADGTLVVSLDQDTRVVAVTPTNGSAGTSFTLPAAAYPNYGEGGFFGSSHVLWFHGRDPSTNLRSVYRVNVDGSGLGRLRLPEHVGAGSLWGAPGFAPPVPDGYFSALRPRRIADTTPGASQPYAGQTLGARTTLAIKVTGRGGIPTTRVSAVVLNVTALSTSNSYITTWPTGLARPRSSSHNLTANVRSGNQVTVRPGVDGTVSFYNSAGSTNLKVDVVGYYSEAGSAYFPLDPTRISDTRAGSGKPNAGQPLAASGGTVNVQVSGLAGVPNDAAAAVVQLTVPAAAANGYLSAYPSGSSSHGLATVTFKSGQTLTRQAIVPLGSGAFTVRNSAPQAVDLVTDIVGYYRADRAGAVFVPTVPTRLVDTRTGSGYLGAGDPLGARRWSSYHLPATTLSNVQAVVANTAALTRSSSTFLTSRAGYPYRAGTIVSAPAGSVGFSNQTDIKTAFLCNRPGCFAVYNNAGTTQLLIDMQGFFY